MKYTLLFAAAVLFLGGSLACAETITIENPSFEEPPTGHLGGALPTGWSVDGSTDFGTEVSAYDGLQCMFVGSGSGGSATLYQLTDHTVTPGDEYTLTFYGKFTWTSAGWPGSYEGGLYYDDNGTRTMLGIASDSFDSSAEGYQWHEYIVVVPIAAGNPAIGKKLGFSYTNTTEQAASYGNWAGCDLVSVENANTHVARLPDPADGDELVDPATDFDWAPPPAYTPEGYEMYLRPNDPNFTVPGNIVDGEDVTPVYDHPDDLEYDTLYYWRIDSSEPNLLGPGSILNTGPTWSFTTAPETPTITLHPISQTVAAGSEVDLTIDGTNIDPPRAQWYKDDVELTGKTGLTLTISNLQAGDAGGEGYYHCVPSNDAGAGDPSNAARLLTRRLAGWWKLNDNLDDSVTEEVPTAPAHPGASIIFPYYVPSGKDGGAVGFNSFQSPVVIQESTDYFNFYTNGFTLSVWVNTTQGGWVPIVSKSTGLTAGYHIGSADTSGFGFFTMREHNGAAFNGDVFSDAVVNDGQWHLLTGVFDGDTQFAKIYVDGKLLGTTPNPNTAEMLGTDVPLAIGSWGAGDETSALEGLVDDVRIWTYALDDIAIALLYTDFNPGSEVCVANPVLDTTGPEGTPDCKVNFYEFVEWAAVWAECNVVPTCWP